MILLSVFLVYLFVLLGLALEGFTYRPIKTSEAFKAAECDLPLSIIVIYKNEEENLKKLLEDFAAQEYPTDLLEFILVNDRSTDKSEAVVNSFIKQNPELSITSIQREINSASGKKDGITQAVQLARYEHILCTDADCRLPTSWASSYARFYDSNKEAHFAAGPVHLHPAKTWVERLQEFEMMSLQISTIGGFHLQKPFMCNGANMSFTKTAFESVNGYEGNDHIQSGDDVFLMEKLHQLDAQRCFSNPSITAMVKTAPVDSWSKMIQQRARWAGKSNQTKSLLNKLLAFIVFITSLSFLMLPIYWMAGMVTINLIPLLMLLKLFTDIVVIFLASRKLEIKLNWTYIPFLWLIYPVAVCQITAQVSLGKNKGWSSTVNLRQDTPQA